MSETADVERADRIAIAAVLFGFAMLERRSVAAA
jgi:hypothetical protein